MLVFLRRTLLFLSDQIIDEKSAVMQKSLNNILQRERKIDHVITKAELCLKIGELTVEDTCSGDLLDANIRIMKKPKFVAT